MLRELGRALAESSDTNQALRRLHEEGYQLFLLLDRAGRVAVPAGDATESAEAESPSRTASSPPILEPVFRIHGQDLRFLRSIGIDPTRRIRRRNRG